MFVLSVVCILCFVCVLDSVLYDFRVGFMKSLQKISPELSLRLGLGIMYLYSGIDLIRHPTAWHWAVRPLPAAIQNFIHTQIGINRYLVIQGVGELVLAFILLAWFLPKRWVYAVSVLAALEMALILTFITIDAVTFRDIGLLGAACALALLMRPARGSQSTTQ